MASERVVLFVASPGGHIDELKRLAERMDTTGRRVVWVTAETTQTRSLLADHDARFVSHIGPRELAKAMAAVPRAALQLRKWRVAHVVSTGAAMAVPYMLASRLVRCRFTFIESAARQSSLSTTARFAERVPGVILRTQASSLASSGWHATGSVFDGYTATPSSEPQRVKRIVVSLGGERFPFPRAVRKIQSILPDDVHVTWQLGSTVLEGFGADLAWLAPDALSSAMRQADAVLIHSGVGSALAAMDAGKAPILLVREHAFGEHIDDHQRDLATELEQRRLAVAPGIESLDWTVVQEASSRVVSKRTSVARIDVGWA